MSRSYQSVCFCSKVAKIHYLRFYEELMSDLLSYVRGAWSECVRTC